FAEQAKWNLRAAHDAIIKKCVEQMHFANRHRREPPIYKVDDLIYLSMANLNMPKGQSTISLELPPKLIACWTHPMLHMKLVCSHVENNDEYFPNKEADTFYELGMKNKQEWFIDEIISH
ncbi:hypothetical protein M422DRAFT_170852, partial [Sphaerobolus stellatus SS14]